MDDWLIVHEEGVAEAGEHSNAEWTWVAPYTKCPQSACQGMFPHAISAINVATSKPTASSILKILKSAIEYTNQ